MHIIWYLKFDINLVTLAFLVKYNWVRIKLGLIAIRKLEMESHYGYLYNVTSEREMVVSWFDSSNLLVNEWLYKDSVALGFLVRANTLTYSMGIWVQLGRERERERDIQLGREREQNRNVIY